MALSDVGKTAGKLRDGAHVVLGGKNASGLDHKIVTVKGTDEFLIVSAPDGYIVTGGGWRCPERREKDLILGSYPSDDGKKWIVELRHRRDGESRKFAEVTAYAVCVRDDG